MEFFRSLAVIAVLLISVNSFADETLDAAKCAQVEGLKGMTQILKVMPSGYGDVNFHIHRWKVQAMKASELKKQIKDYARRMGVNAQSRQLNQMALDLDLATQGGYGDVYYWIHKQEVQQKVFNNCSETLSVMLKSYCK